MASLIRTAGRHGAAGRECAPHPLAFAATAIPALLAAARAALIAAAAAGLLAGAPAARAGSPYASSMFDPRVSVVASTTQAGASPDLVIRMRKPANRCQPPILYADAVQEWCDSAYIEQNLRDWTIHLPPGLMADPNAAPQCNDPQYTLIDPNGNAGNPGYHCPPATKVGDVVLSPRSCFVDQVQFAGRNVDACLLVDDVGGQPGAAPLLGEVYNGIPGPAEQAHLYVIAGPPIAGFPPPLHYKHFVRIDASVRVRTGLGADYGIDSATTSIPDAAPLTPLQQPGLPQILFEAAVYDAAITLYGSTGVQTGHPLLVNPTSCSKRNLWSDFTGYAQNSYSPGVSGAVPGTGTGLTATDSVRYAVTGCNRLSFDPKLSLSLDPPTPGAAAAITTTLTQARGEQAIDEVKVTIPREFRVNTANRVSQCDAQTFQSGSCPAGSVIGRAEADSYLLPTGSLPLSGPVYLGETTQSDINVYAELSGFIHVRLQGSLKLNSDGSSEAIFSALPEVPVDRFTLTLNGGAGAALLLLPRTCGPKQVAVEFRSHNGQISRQSAPAAVSCTGASLKASLSPRRPAANATLGLSARADGITRATFTLPRRLMRRSGAANLDVGSSYGTVSFVREADSPIKGNLVLVGRSSKGSLSFAAVRRKTTVSSGSIYKKRVLLRNRRTGRSRTAGLVRLSLTPIPSGTTRIDIVLRGKPSRFLQNPRSCKQRLAFVAYISDGQGTSHRPRTSLKLSCSAKGQKARARRRSGR